MMALKDIVPSHVEHIEDYALSYTYRGEAQGYGFSFPCDKDGNVRQIASTSNYLYCRYEAAKPDGAVTFDGIADYSRDYREPGYGTCDCGRTVYLDRDYGHGIDCECGRIYNMSGQELAPRSQWEERWDEDSTVPYCDEFGYRDE
jgi:hypothetical protein